MGRGAVRPTDLRFCKKRDLNYHRGAYKLECEACFLNRRMARGWKVEGRNNGKIGLATDRRICFGGKKMGNKGDIRREYGQICMAKEKGKEYGL